MNYTFEYMFIPMIIENSKKDEFDLDTVEIFDDFEFTRGCFYDKYPKECSGFDWKSFSICKEMNHEVTYWLLRFPEPKKEPEAKWGLILKKGSKSLRYFTLETCESGKLALCSCEKGSHLCHDILDADTTVDAFIAKASAL